MSRATMFADAQHDPGLTQSFRLRDRLARPEPLLAVELRPPRRDLQGVRAMEAWIDVYHALDKLSAVDTAIFLTDSAVGTGEEENLSHLVRNLGPRAVRQRIVPFLTLKHPQPYCFRYAARAASEHFPGLVVLGGDRHDGIPRCFEHAWELREQLRLIQPGQLLGGWVNPYRNAPQQVEYLLRHRRGVDFALTQVISHHDLAPVESFLEEAARRGLDLPLVAGVFYYRSARRKTLEQLARFIPVPVAGITADFDERGMDADTVAATTLRALGDMGFTRWYLSNLETSRAPAILRRIAGLAGLPDPRASAAKGQERERRG